MLKAVDVRAKARQALAGHWKTAVLAGIIVSIVVTGSLGGFGLDVRTEWNESGLIAELWPLSEVMLPLSIGVVFALILVGGVISIVLGAPLCVGYARFYLRIIDDGEAQLGDLVACYGRMKTIVWANVLRTLHILGGTLMLIVPGIIAFYSYTLTEYILAEHPELTAKEAMEMCNEMMEGNRWRLFCLDLSFIGWNILMVVTLGLSKLWVDPYQEASRAVFYRSLTQKNDTNGGSEELA